MNPNDKRKTTKIVYSVYCILYTFDGNERESQKAQVTRGKSKKTEQRERGRGMRKSDAYTNTHIHKKQNPK